MVSLQLMKFLFVSIYRYIYGGKLSVYLVILITPTGCDKLNCIAIAQPLVHVHHAVYCFVNLDND